MRGKKIYDVTNQRFNKLIAIKFIKIEKHSTYWLFKCNCGNKTIKRVQDVKSGKTQSCGCLFLETVSTHKMSYTKFYSRWKSIFSRCVYNTHASYKYYGGRGITICKRWLKFENFKNDMYKSYLKHVKKYGIKQTTIDRIDNNGNYEKSNCRWATMKEQANNKNDNRLITFNNKTMSLTKWADKLNISVQSLCYRLNNWTINKTFDTKKRPYVKTKTQRSSTFNIL